MRCEAAGPAVENLTRYGELGLGIGHWEQNVPVYRYPRADLVIGERVGICPVVQLRVSLGIEHFEERLEI